MSFPTANIEWNKIPRGSHVELRGEINQMFVYIDANGNEFVANWCGQTAHTAQGTLNSMVNQTKKRMQQLQTSND